MPLGIPIPRIHTLYSALCILLEFQHGRRQNMSTVLVVHRSRCKRHIRSKPRFLTVTTIPLIDGCLRTLFEEIEILVNEYQFTSVLRPSLSTVTLSRDQCFIYSLNNSTCLLRVCTIPLYVSLPFFLRLCYPFSFLH